MVVGLWEVRFQFYGERGTGYCEFQLGHCNQAAWAKVLARPPAERVPEQKALTSVPQFPHSKVGTIRGLPQRAAVGIMQCEWLMWDNAQLAGHIILSCCPSLGRGSNPQSTDKGPEAQRGAEPGPGLLMSSSRTET